MAENERRTGKMTWTVQHIRKRVVEAFRTSHRLPGGYLPQQYGNAMPTPVRAASDAYGYHPVKVQATGKQIAEMEEVFGWIVELPTREQRIEVLRYGEIKTSRKATFAQYLEKNDIHRRNYERKISKIFQIIADKQNHIPKTRNKAPYGQESQILAYEQADKLEKPRPTHWMAEGARPKHLARD